MMTSGSRIRQIGWAAVLAACGAVFVAFSLHVLSVKSEVLLAERQIIKLERETLMLETEFQTRASQRQLAEWNAVELGYRAPRADQYLESERQLAALGLERGPDAPAPIRVAREDLADADGARREMVSPLTGEPITLAAAQAGDAGTVFAEAFGDFLIEASPIREAKAQSPTVSAAAPRGGEVTLASEGGE